MAQAQGQEMTEEDRQEMIKQAKQQMEQMHGAGGFPGTEEDAAAAAGQQDPNQF
jgi:hypothetical protein